MNIGAKLIPEGAQFRMKADRQDGVAAGGSVSFWDYVVPVGWRAVVTMLHLTFPFIQEGTAPLVSAMRWNLRRNGALGWPGMVAGVVGVGVGGALLAPPTPMNVWPVSPGLTSIKGESCLVPLWCEFAEGNRIQADFNNGPGTPVDFVCFTAWWWEIPNSPGA